MSELTNRFKELQRRNSAGLMESIEIRQLIHELEFALSSATPAGTIISDDNDNRPPDNERVFYRTPRRDDSWSDLRINSGWVLQECEIWWPIPEGMFQPPEPKP